MKKKLISESMWGAQMFLRMEFIHLDEPALILANTWKYDSLGNPLLTKGVHDVNFSAFLVWNGANFRYVSGMAWLSDTSLQLPSCCQQSFYHMWKSPCFKDYTRWSGTLLLLYSRCWFHYIWGSTLSRESRVHSWQRCAWKTWKDITSWPGSKIWLYKKFHRQKSMKEQFCTGWNPVFWLKWQCQGLVAYWKMVYALAFQSQNLGLILHEVGWYSILPALFLLVLHQQHAAKYVTASACDTCLYIFIGAKSKWSGRVEEGPYTHWLLISLWLWL